VANSNAPSGFSPVRFANGRPYNGAVTRYFVPATDATALFIGDPVILAGSADSRGIPTVTRATAGGGAYTTGVVVSFDPDPANLTLTYRPASTARYVQVADDPDLLFEIQEDSVGSSLAATNVGQNADFVAGTGSTSTGQSGFQLDSSTANVTNTLQCRIVALANREDNDIGTNAKWLVTFNLHSQRNLTGI
jgi:hypothetical protein